MSRRLVGLLLVLSLLATSCADRDDAADGTRGLPAIERYDVSVVNTYSHDTSAYTQGLEFVDGLLLESTGRRGISSIRLVDPVSGTIVDQTALDPNLYGEGATVVGDEVWQLTYTSETVLVHQLGSLTESRRLPYDGEGWGLCHNGTRFVMSNGSAELSIRDSDSFEEVRRIEVTAAGDPVPKLNELECVAELVWANIYQTTNLIAIDQAGAVVGLADLSELVPDGFRGDNELVLNGIAYNPDTGRFWVTGKEWPVMYEIELTPPS